jgi:hypothetical protein
MNPEKDPQLGLIKPISETEFLKTIIGSAPPTDGLNSWFQTWAERRSPHLCRIFNILNTVEEMSGPTLDVGSEGASFFRPIRKYRSDLLPYLCTDLDDRDRVIDGEVIKRYQFECDKDLLPIDSQSIGLVLFCDVIEHLLVDPVWTLLEFNRVLKQGGILLVSTPNVSCISRAIRALQGHTPCDESQYTPTFIGGRHNREWTPSELQNCLNNLGFELIRASTNHEAIPTEHLTALKKLREIDLAPLPDHFYGPDIVMVFRKVTHLTLDSELSVEQRWPSFLYTGADCYRRRPQTFPIIAGKDPATFGS